LREGRGEKGAAALPLMRVSNRPCDSSAATNVVSMGVSAAIPEMLALPPSVVGGFGVGVDGVGMGMRGVGVEGEGEGAPPRRPAVCRIHQRAARAA